MLTYCCGGQHMCRLKSSFPGIYSDGSYTVYPKKYAHGFVVLCFVVVMQSFIMNSHEAFIHIHQGCFAGTGAIVRLPQCQWSKPDGYGKISQCITTTKHSKAKTVCIYLGIYCKSCYPKGSLIHKAPLINRISGGIEIGLTILIQWESHHDSNSFSFGYAHMWDHYLKNQSSLGSYSWANRKTDA